MYSKFKPTLIFEYNDKNERKSIHFRDLIKGNKDKKVPIEGALFWRTFDRLYEQVPEEYWNLGNFGLAQAEEKKLHKFKGVNMLKNADDLRFYYGKGKDYLSFSLFRKDVFYVEFN